ncbi:hypothetical protein OG2516_14795 [Oceanicola granulosus HTCC2516]|uniref:protein-glutamate O-methyltransferase n=1 Tax=Oceanicola granulosus (strain ATCC BAA-861 / DSM 15982 / KCTC 12143 / HTCC2516) TaxID=314256 RepID=Q2CEV6_OCEGH|nr:chemotaxis protein CheB [Oceanicola granulosus]EAR51152.1 hypothetical protein OG2516_14795 [Oceanicola granulosus HTCC2516]
MRDSDADAQTPPLRFVGIAASAGGLEAASLLMQNIPKSANAVYVIAQHMSPTHKSLLSTLIAHETDLPVAELRDDTEPLGDTIYVTPPNSDVTFEDGRLRLSEPSGHPAAPKPSADRLFKSLAAECGDKCVGIVLSGTGSDGSYGVQAIREAGGITIAQDPASAKYNGMPASAIETGCVDLTLTPEQIGQHLDKILASPRDFDSLRRLNEEPSKIADLLQILHARTRVDFREYKETTISRRITRRMAALGIDDYEKYVDHCRASEQEVDALHRDLLISVTRFFRDPEQFRQLRREIERLIGGREAPQLRIWVAGCATGEEAYSIAILVAEALGGPASLQKNKLQIFATDIDERALEVGRRGVYPISVVQDVPREYLEKYFVISGSELTVSSELRAVTLFSKHNIFQDPPFIKVDLVSLRNVLIYFNASLQERVLNRILYALAPDGLLFLGTAESVGNLDTWFEARARADKIYGKRRSGQRPSFGSLGSGGGQSALARAADPRDVKAQDEGTMFDALARSVAPNGFLATKNGDIVRVFGDISRFIQVTEQSALSLNLRLLSATIRDEATSLMAIALKTREMRPGRWHDFETVGANRARLLCFPVASPSGGEDHCLFAIHTRLERSERTDIESLSADERTAYVSRIEAEMRSTREALQQTVEELQTSNEELQSVNEEMQSTNEEMQATNEELETSNEELQATNEELITVNEEMQVNAAELQRVSTELAAILCASPYVVVVVDQALIVRRASDRALQMFDIGRLPTTGFHLSQCALPPEFPSLTKIASEVFKLRTPRTLSLESGGIAYAITFTPYTDSLGQLMGQMITVVEVDMLTFDALSDLIRDMSGASHWRYNLRTGRFAWSGRVAEIYGLGHGDSEPGLSETIGSYHPDDAPRVAEMFDACLQDGTPFSYEARLLRKDGRVAHVEASGALVRDRHGEPAYMVGVFRETAPLIRAELLGREQAALEDRLEFGHFIHDTANGESRWSDGLRRLLGVDDATPASLNALTERLHPDEREMVAGLLAKAERDALPVAARARLDGPEGLDLLCEIHAQVRTAQSGEVTHLFGSLRALPEGESGPIGLKNI